jgi:hypothetical protein
MLNDNEKHNQSIYIRSSLAADHSLTHPGSRRRSNALYFDGSGGGRRLAHEEKSRERVEQATIPKQMITYNEYIAVQVNSTLLNAKHHHITSHHSTAQHSIA